jgi:RimJ/RimL family protein N-acetyltransferase
LCLLAKDRFRMEKQETNHAITTDRLLLRRWRAEDIDPFAAICNDHEVMRYIGCGATRSRDQSAAAILAYETGWEEKGYGLFAVELLDGNSLIGFTGLTEPTFLPEIMPAVELGWRFARQSWGSGYATEAARAALDFGLATLRMPEIVSIYQAENRASERIVEKLGMRFDRETLDASCGRLVRIHRT